MMKELLKHMAIGFMIGVLGSMLGLCIGIGAVTILKHAIPQAQAEEAVVPYGPEYSWNHSYRMFTYGEWFRDKERPSHLYAEIRSFVKRSTNNNISTFDNIVEMYETISGGIVEDQKHVNHFLATLYFEDVYDSAGGREALFDMCTDGIKSARGYCWT